MANEKKDQKAFGGSEFPVQVRPGSKAPWWELIVKKPDGTEIKMIGRKVDRFYSEKDETF